MFLSILPSFLSYLFLLSCCFLCEDAVEVKVDQLSVRSLMLYTSDLELQV
jgi:hypothetical protein